MPSHVACAGLHNDDAHTIEERRYIDPLMRAGWTVSADPSGTGLQVDRS